MPFIQRLRHVRNRLFKWMNEYNIDWRVKTSSVETFKKKTQRKSESIYDDYIFPICLSLMGTANRKCLVHYRKLNCPGIWQGTFKNIAVILWLVSEVSGIYCRRKGSIHYLADTFIVRSFGWWSKRLKII